MFCLEKERGDFSNVSVYIYTYTGTCVQYVRKCNSRTIVEGNIVKRLLIDSKKEQCYTQPDNIIFTLVLLHMSSLPLVSVFKFSCVCVCVRV